MVTPVETITEEMRLAWEEMSAKWAEETSWPTLKEATKVYGAAEQEHETATFLVQDLEIQIEDLESQLRRLPEDLWKLQADIIRQQIIKKQAEILSCEDRLILIEQRVLRHREIYHHLLTVHNRKIQKERFPEREWPRRQSQCVGPPDETEESEEDDYETDVSKSAERNE
ncbi:hypothetical protein KR032_005810 [Drosophila birchii]|nr:hypothetical protein KR032_005810 [Drosophila birchii]